MTYNDQIVIQQYTQSRGDYGEVDAGTWSTYKSLWAEIDYDTDNKNFTGDMNVATDSKSFRIHTPDAPDVTTKMRVSYDSRFFDIVSIDRDGRLFTTLTATAFDDE